MQKDLFVRMRQECSEPQRVLPVVKGLTPGPCGCITNCGCQPGAEKDSTEVFGVMAHDHCSILTRKGN